MTMEISESLSNKIANMGFVSACLVVLLHIFPSCDNGSSLRLWDDFIACGPGRAAVPFFALVSGLMLGRHCTKEGWYKVEVKKRIRTLLVPFVIWNCCFAALGISGGFGLFFDRCAGMLDPFHQPPLGPLWYVRSLIVFVLCSPVLVGMVRKYPRVVLATLFVLSATLYIPGSRRLTLFVTLFHLEALFYFSVGLAIAVWHVGLGCRVGLGWVCAFGGVAIVLTGVRMALKQDGGFLYHCLRAFVVPGWLMMIWKIVPSRRWSARVTACAFPVYLMHCFVFVIFRKFFGTMNTWEGYFALVMGGIVLPMLIANLMTSERIAMLLFGGRGMKREYDADAVDSVKNKQIGTAK